MTKHITLVYRGPVNVYCGEDYIDKYRVTDIAEIQKLNGVKHESDLTDFLFCGPGEECLEELDMKDGEMGLELIENTLYFYIKYSVNKQLNEEQLETLWEFNMGQMSDGAGPIFSGHCFDEYGLTYEEPDKLRIFYQEK
ncbi:MAG: hypothetical protein AAGB12_03410 [Pseudomonadota bacterium]